MFDELKSRMNKFWNDDRTLAQTDPEFIERITPIWTTPHAPWPFWRR